MGGRTYQFGERGPYEEVFRPGDRLLTGETRRDWWPGGLYLLREDASRLLVSVTSGAVIDVALEGGVIASTSWLEGDEARAVIAEEVIGGSPSPWRDEFARVPIGASVHEALGRFSERPFYLGFPATEDRLRFGSLRDGVFDVLLDPRGKVVGHQSIGGFDALDILDAEASAGRPHAGTGRKAPYRARTRLEARLFALADGLEADLLLHRGGLYCLQGSKRWENGRWSMEFCVDDLSEPGLGAGPSPWLDVVDLVRCADMIEYGDASFESVEGPPLDRAVARMAVEEALKLFPADQSEVRVETARARNRGALESRPGHFRRERLEARAARLAEPPSPDPSPVEPGEWERELIEAVKKKDLGWMRELLGNGVDPNVRDERGRPLLFHAIVPEYWRFYLHGRKPMLEELLAAGADPALDDIGAFLCRRASRGIGSESCAEGVAALAGILGVPPESYVDWR